MAVQKNDAARACDYSAFGFKGRTAIVTGGVRGLGRAIADALAAAGAEVHVFDWDISGAEGAPFTVHKVDISSSESVNAAVSALPSPPELLVNNAGITRDKRIVNMSDEDWAQVIGVNLTGAFNLIRATAPAMSASGFGRIVNIASINGIRGKFGQANYTAAKAGLIGLTKTAARELGAKGITVNAVAPGMVLTDMTLALDEQFRQKALDETVLKALPAAPDLANAVLFFLSDAAKFVTGQVLKVDSGQYI
ncbi:MAG: SDR family oxidoreductase [Alphaproteobacteria bacterium]|nr:SDR family oxidoreductase [Alphaproteobacteria bacterium]